MKDLKFTQEVKDYLESNLQERDVKEGAMLLLRLTGNQIMYRNILVNPQRHADFVEYQLRKHYNLRIANITHQEVVKMQQAADSILAEHCSEKEDSPTRKGKRIDHDALPEKIQQLYVENLDILRRMRDLQTRLRLLSEDPKTCPDSDRYPFLKELISLDKQMHDNWNQYDHYIVGKGVVIKTDIVEEESNLVKRINLLAGKYAKSPTSPLRDSIVELYNKLALPSDKLTAKLKGLGLI